MSFHTRNNHIIKLKFSIMTSLLLLNYAALATSYTLQIDPSKQIQIQNGQQPSLLIGGVSFHPHKNKSWQSHLQSLCSNQNQVACQYQDILNRLQFNILEIERIKKEQVEEGIPEEEQDDGDEIEIDTLLLGDLTLLTVFHEEQLQSASYDIVANGDYEDDFNLQKEHYNRAIGALLASEYYHTNAWILLSKQEVFRDGDGDNMPPFVYERHSISYGAYGVGLHLSDLHERYYAVYHPDISNDSHGVERAASVLREAYIASYRYLLSCEYWCIQSQMVLDSIDFDWADRHREHAYDPHEEIYKEQMKRQHVKYVYPTRQALAMANVRIGILFLTMYSVGYMMTEDEMLSYNPVAEEILLEGSTMGYYDHVSEEEQWGQHYSEQIRKDIKQSQERLLKSIIQRIRSAIAIYDELSKIEIDDENFGDDRTLLGDSHYHLGLAYQYIGDYKSAIAEWRTSLDIYRNVFNEYQTSSGSASFDGAGMTSIADVVQNLITTSQLCCDVVLSLGHYVEAKDLYRLNLKLKRYSVDGTSIEEGLIDHDSNLDDGVGEDEWNNFQYNEISAISIESIDASIKEHQQLLDEYYKMLLNNPDGSYHEMQFDVDGSPLASMATSDSVYEGSLRSVLGSLHLAKNDVKAARDELELAISLLKRGIKDEQSGMWDSPAKDINGNELSLQLYLADALLNLSYAQAGMMQWYGSMMSFEEALAIYEKELPKGEGPFGNRKENAGKSSREPVQQREGWIDTLKSKFGIKVENYHPQGNSTTDHNSVYGEL